MSEQLPFNSASYYHWLSEHKVMGCRNRTSGKFYFPAAPDVHHQLHGRHGVGRSLRQR